MATRYHYQVPLAHHNGPNIVSERLPLRPISLGVTVAVSAHPWARLFRQEGDVRCLAKGASENSANRMPARLALKTEFLQERTAEALALMGEDHDADGDSGSGSGTPKITTDHVAVSFARSGGPGGQNVNKLNTKVDMRFNVYEAEWLPERIRLKIIEQEKNRINSDGELVVSSTRTRTQKGNIEDALAKIQKIIDAAAYVPPPPSKEKEARIKKLAKAENERRLQGKQQHSKKKAERRNKGSWD